MAWCLQFGEERTTMKSIVFWSITSFVLFITVSYIQPAAAGPFGSSNCVIEETVTIP
jgi:hypothetical protein